MSNLSLIRVNQKLAQARTVINSGGSAQATVVFVNSIMESAAFHLACAYHHYLREIAETYGVKSFASLDQEADVIKALLAAAKHPAEAQELQALRNNPESWLAELHVYYKSLWTVPVAADAQADDSLIQAINLDSPKQIPVTLDLIAQWHSAFVELVQRQRETSAEF